MNAQSSHPPEALVLWYAHEKVRHGEWQAFLTGPATLIVDEMITRRDVVRRNGQPCRFKALPPGEVPQNEG